MRQSLNTAPSIRRYIELVILFKQWYNKDQSKKSLYLFNENLYGNDLLFKSWIRRFHNIRQLDLHMKNIEKNYNPKDLYFKRSTGYYKIVNR